MEKRFVNIGGQKLRVEVNWNAVEEFARLKGVPIYDVLSLDLRDGDNLKVMMTAAIKEGERLEGREFTKTPVEVGEIVTISAIKVFLDVYQDHFVGTNADGAAAPADGEDAKKKPGATGS